MENANSTLIPNHLANAKVICDRQILNLEHMTDLAMVNSYTVKVTH